MPAGNMHVDEVNIDVSLVGRLLAARLREQPNRTSGGG